VRELAEAIRAEAGALLARHNIHARLKLSSQRGCNVITQMMVEQKVGMVSLNWMRVEIGKLQLREQFVVICM
jgi:alpha-D-ribose 1-methylphosphonate 5-triphosphate diphosphatase PhnM